MSSPVRESYRAVRIKVAVRLVFEAMAHLLKPPEGVWVVEYSPESVEDWKPWPEEAEVFDCHYEFMDRTFHFLVQHSSFASVPEGEGPLAVYLRFLRTDIHAPDEIQ